MDLVQHIWLASAFLVFLFVLMIIGNDSGVLAFVLHGYLM